MQNKNTGTTRYLQQHKVNVVFLNGLCCLFLLDVTINVSVMYVLVSHLELNENKLTAQSSESKYILTDVDFKQGLCTC